MRFLGIIFLGVFLIQGYCAAAHGFGEDMSIFTKVAAKTMGMATCHDMPEKTDANKSHIPAKSGGMNCKACCLSGLEADIIVAVHARKIEIQRFPVEQDNIPEAPLYSVFHPPKILI